MLDRGVFRGKAAEWRKTHGRVEWLDTIAGGPGYRIKKLRFEAIPGLFIPALLYEPEKLSGKVPVVMNVHGHHMVEGMSVPSKQTRCINQAKRGMLVLSPEWIGTGQLFTSGFAHLRMNQLDLCGTSGLAVFYLAMERGLDVLLSLEHADPTRVAVTGLSGGGWQTIMISSLDPRVTLANPVAGYSSFRSRVEHVRDLGDSEQAPCDLATLVDLYASDRDAGPAADAIDVQLEGRLLFQVGLCAPAAAGRRLGRSTNFIIEKVACGRM